MSAAPNSRTRGRDPRTQLRNYWNSLAFHYPKPGRVHAGIYIPANAPPGTFFIGRGIVVETGITPQGRFYVWVEPVVRKPRDRRKKPLGLSTAEFWDPAGYRMPDMYLPRDIVNLKRSAGTDSDAMLCRRPDGDRPKLEEFPREDVKPGDEALGVYGYFDGRRRIGVGRVINTEGEGVPVRVDGVDRKLVANVEPILGQMHRYGWDPELHYMDQPVSIAGLDPINDSREKPKMPDYKRCSHSHLVSNDDYFPPLGSEGWGAFAAPDGRWYVGVGRVIATGRRRDSCHGYVLVVPISGKTGGDYDFFHPVTGEYMPTFVPPITPSMRWPWRTFFARGLSEIAPGFKDAFELFKIEPPTEYWDDSDRDFWSLTDEEDC
ncbi:hypothetical protein ASPCAL01797 [Aspergillus calidoustus]|uniref:Uncharacterized protein n=1 Tax=Aspergillus calidoustus TaxID=454130 RepID=A0A0U5CLK0_ASPCI|nr:hypothetical protein ASPCAL01797 [Aspergillus calidoustus]